MATSVIEIWNQALSELGTRTTVASEDENSNEAIQCKLNYTTTRDQLLRMAHWDFAKKMDTAALLKSAPGTPENSDTAAGAWSNAWPAPPWLYAYAYPSDCVLLRAVLPQPYLTDDAMVPIFSVPQSSGTPIWSAPARFSKSYDTDTNGNQVISILTNQRQALFQYTAHVSNPNFYDHLFLNALQVGLAAEICMALTGDQNLEKRLTQKANDLVMAARAMDGNEGLTIQNHTPDWLRVRGFGNQEYMSWNTAEPYGPMFGGVGW